MTNKQTLLKRVGEFIEGEDWEWEGSCTIDIMLLELLKECHEALSNSITTREALQRVRDGVEDKLPEGLLETDEALAIIDREIEKL